MNAATSAGEMKQTYPQGRWTLRANPFKSSVVPASRPAVQGELSLEKVKPVRNDLSDSDLELVPVKPAKSVEAKQENVFSAPTGVEVKKESWWARLKQRLPVARAG